MIEGINVIEGVKPKTNKTEKEKKPAKIPDVIIWKTIAEHDELWVNTEQRAQVYATVTKNGKRKNLEIEDGEYIDFMAVRFNKATCIKDDKGVVLEPGRYVSPDGVKAALSYLRGNADSYPKHMVYRRYARTDDAIYVDLNDAQQQVVRVTADGWKVTKECPVKFHRAGVYGEMPLPVPGGSVDLLREFISCGDKEFLLLTGWMLDVMKGHGPYMICGISGEHGTSKSSTSRSLKMLVDPVTMGEPLKSAPKDAEELSLTSEYSHVLAYDNLSGINHGVSDLFCKTSTGFMHEKRQLYHDKKLVQTKICNPMILNGITDIANQPDLIDRMVAVKLLRPERVRGPRELEAAYTSKRPMILGALLDLLVMGLRRFDETTIEDLPRMADSVRWIVACLGSTDWLDAYRVNAADAVENAVDASVVGSCFKDCINSGSVDQAYGVIDRPGWFEGTSQQLLQKLNSYLLIKRGQYPNQVKGWPTTPSHLSGQLTRLKPALKNHFDIMERRTKSDRLISVKKVTAGDGE